MSSFNPLGVDLHIAHYFSHKALSAGTLNRKHLSEGKNIFFLALTTNFNSLLRAGLWGCFSLTRGCIILLYACTLLRLAT